MRCATAAGVAAGEAAAAVHLSNLLWRSRYLAIVYTSGYLDPRSSMYTSGFLSSPPEISKKPAIYIASISYHHSYYCSIPRLDTILLLLLLRKVIHYQGQAMCGNSPTAAASTYTVAS